MDDRDGAGSTERGAPAPYGDLARFARALGAERSFDRLLELVVREAAALIRAERSSIFLLDRESHEVWVRSGLGIRKGGIHFPAHCGLAGHVATTGEALNVPDAYADPRFNAAVDRRTGYRTRNALCMPLRARDGRLIGALEMLNKIGGGPFLVEDEHLAEALAAHCATAIENALLYERLRAAPRRGTARTQPPTLLVADDDPELASVIAQALDDFRVVRALDGEEALERFQAERPDLLLLDVIMPKKDGFETCRAIRAAPAGRELPIIMLSGSTEPRHVVRAFEVGANDYMIKPFSTAQLRAKAHTWLLRATRPGE